MVPRPLTLCAACPAFRATIKGGTNPCDYPTFLILGLAVSRHARQLSEHHVHRAPLTARGCPRPGGWQGAQPVLRPRALTGYKGLLSSLGSASTVTCPVPGTGRGRASGPQPGPVCRGRGSWGRSCTVPLGWGHGWFITGGWLWLKTGGQKSLPGLCHHFCHPGHLGWSPSCPCFAAGQEEDLSQPFLHQKSQGESDAEQAPAASIPHRGVGIKQREPTFLCFL